MRTADSGTSSSSAANCGNAVCTPCPISLRGIASTTPPSGRILIQPLSAKSPSPGAIRLARPRRDRCGSAAQPTSSAPMPAVAPSSQVRRFTRASRPRA
jgi:hypothetical protein